MSFPVRRRACAEAELFAHIDWIASRNSDAAIRFAAAIEHAFMLLAHQPEIGTPHTARSPRLYGLRKWAIPKFPNYLLFYLFRGEYVDVLHIYRGEQDYDDDLESNG